MPVIYFTINFLLFIFFLWFLLRKPISAFLKKRKTTFIDSHAEAKTNYDTAVSKLNEIKTKFSDIEKEGKVYVDEMTKQAGTEGKMVVFNAEAYAKTILSGSRDIVSEEVKRARNKQVTSFVHSVIAKTKVSVKNESVSKDYDGVYMKDYFNETKGSGS